MTIRVSIVESAPYSSQIRRKFDMYSREQGEEYNDQ